MTAKIVNVVKKRLASKPTYYLLLMELKTIDISYDFRNDIYFFILKRLKNRDDALEILQNSFVKIHCNLYQLKNRSKRKAWVFQIVRNETINYFNKNQPAEQLKGKVMNTFEGKGEYEDLCCFDRFLEGLPERYRDVMYRVYVIGKTQQQAGDELGISPANVKARIHRGKGLLIEKFNSCCKFDLNGKGKLFGKSNFTACNGI